LTSFEKFATPFGEINVDIKYIKKLLTKKDIFFEVDKSIDINEHSIEMELPFLKYIFKDRKFSILPMVIGHGDFGQNKELGKCLYDLYEDPKTLFVISSDFCHWGKDFRYTYYNNKFKTVWESTQDLDNQALNIISEMDSKKFDNYIKNTKNTICGRNPITIILSIIEDYQKKHQNKKITFDKAGYAQSDKVMNMSGRSVSYAAGVNFIQ
jgi:AmmeMemoRadiSam system protein B